MRADSAFVSISKGGIFGINGWLSSLTEALIKDLLPEVTSLVLPLPAVLCCLLSKLFELEDERHS